MSSTVGSSRDALCARVARSHTRLGRRDDLGWLLCPIALNVLALMERSSDDLRGQRDQMDPQTVANPRPSTVRCSSPARCKGRRRRPAPYVFAHPQAVRLVPICGTHTASAFLGP